MGARPLPSGRKFISERGIFVATLLLCVIYITFIGLGIPDSLFGTAWPAIYPELGAPVASASMVTLLISGSTVVSSLLSARLIHRFGTGLVTAASTLLTVFAIFGFSLSPSLLWLCLFAVPLGLGAGAIDSGLNSYVALHYQASHMSFLHCFYGIGISLSPYLMSLALSDQNNWRHGYRVMGLVQAGIAVLALAALPLWKKAAASPLATRVEEARPLSFAAIAKMPAARMVWLVFIGSCAIENLCGIWGSTFLVSAKGLSASQAAQMITFYYVGMALGRFVSGLLAKRVSAWRLIHIGQGVVLAAILLLMLPLPGPAAGVGLFIIGFGNGPLFPNLVHLTPRNFGQDIAPSVMGTQMAASYVGIMAVPPLFSLLAQAAGLSLFPYVLLLLFAVMAAATFGLVRLLKKQGRYDGAVETTL